MRLSLTLCALAVLVSPTVSGQSPESPAARGFELLKSLAGHYTFRDSLQSGPATRPEVVSGTVSYTLVANGTVIQEMVQGPEHGTNNMISMIRLDGNRLVLDHYCSSGTQPRLVSRGLVDGAIRFVYESGTSIPTAETGHIHGATFTISPDGGFESAWIWREKGGEQLGIRRHQR